MSPSLQRIIDLTISLIGIICTLPVMLIIFILGVLDTGSPLFIQIRVGRNQKAFRLIKFRTMHTSTESVGTHLVNSTSITKLGAFLRKTKLDELPQLFNVFCGEMSIVGPRPCLANQAELIKEREDRKVFASLPGITGLGQTNNIDMSTPRKLARYDQLMLKKMSMQLYIKMIFATVLGRGQGDKVKHPKT